MSSICPVHPPQSVPAPQARPTASTESAPSSITSRIVRELTPLQRQTIIDPESSTLKSTFNSNSNFGRFGTYGDLQRGTRAG